MPRRAFRTGAKTRELLAHGIRRVDQMYSPRNLAAMTRIRETIDAAPPLSRPALRLVWHAALIATSQKAQHLEGGGGYLPGMYYVPGVRKERNVAVTMQRIAVRLKWAVREFPGEDVASPISVAVADTRRLSVIPDRTVDYVFLDPPYNDKIQYSEPNFLWEAWLGADDDRGFDDLVVSRSRRQGTDGWLRAMAEVIGECRRVMKPGAWLSFTYVPGMQASAADLWTAFAAQGFERRSDLDGHIRNHQRTFVQRTTSATATDRIVHFRVAR